MCFKRINKISNNKCMYVIRCVRIIVSNKMRLSVTIALSYTLYSYDRQNCVQNTENVLLSVKYEGNKCRNVSGSTCSYSWDPDICGCPQSLTMLLHRCTDYGNVTW